MRKTSPRICTASGGGRKASREKPMASLDGGEGRNSSRSVRFGDEMECAPFCGVFIQIRVDFL